MFLHVAFTRRVAHYSVIRCHFYNSAIQMRMRKYRCINTLKFESIPYCSYYKLIRIDTSIYRCNSTIYSSFPVHVLNTYGTARL